MEKNVSAAMETSVENVVKHPIWRAREPLQAWTTNTEDQWTTAQDLLKHLWATTQLNPFWQAGPYKSSERALFNGVGSTAVGGTDLIWQLLSVEQFSDALVLFCFKLWLWDQFRQCQIWYLSILLHKRASEKMKVYPKKCVHLCMIGLTDNLGIQPPEFS